MSDDALFDAAYHGDLSEVRQLLQEGADPNTYNDELHGTPLHTAAIQHHTHVVRELLAAGADVMVTTSDGRTPLHWAASNGHVDIVQVLLEAGAPVWPVSRMRNTALHEACGAGHLAVVRLMVEEYGGERLLGVGGRKEMTPRELAAVRGQREVVEYLEEVEKWLGSSLGDTGRDLHGKKMFFSVLIIF